MTRSTDALCLPSRTELVRRAEAVSATITPAQIVHEALAEGVAVEFRESRGRSWSAAGSVFNEFRFALTDQIAREVANLLGLEFIPGNFHWRDLAHHPFFCQDAARALQNRMNKEVDLVRVSGSIRNCHLENRWECEVIVALGCKLAAPLERSLKGAPAEPEVKPPTLSRDEGSRLGYLTNDPQVIPSRLRWKLKQGAGLGEELKPLENATLSFVREAHQVLNHRSQDFAPYLTAAAELQRSFEHIRARLKARQEGDWPAPRDADLAVEFGGPVGALRSLADFEASLRPYFPVS